MTRLAACLLSHEFDQRAIRPRLLQLANPRVDRPSGTTRFHRIAGLVQPQMTDLRLAGSGAMIDRAIDHETAAHAAAHVDPAHRVKAATRAAEHLGQRRRVGVILHLDRQARNLAKPIAQRKIRPALDLMRTTNRPRLMVDRPAKTHADRNRPLALDHRRQRRRNLPTDAFPALIRRDRQTFARVNGSPPVARNQLQLRAANLNAQKMRQNICHKATRMPARRRPWQLSLRS